METRKIKTWRNPFGEGFSICRRREIELKSGVTILVGCNGAGKTTMLKNIQESLKRDNIPFLNFDNLHDGGSNSLQEAFAENNFSFISQAWNSSEGENISLNIGKMASILQHFIITGKSLRRRDRLVEAFREINNDEEDEQISNERWILLDAIDSGYSIDNVIDLKELFDTILEDAQKYNVDVYIVASANEYELAANMECFDVMSGKYINFKNYEDYKKYIINTRAKKEKRYNKD